MVAAERWVKLYYKLQQMVEAFPMSDISPVSSLMTDRLEPLGDRLAGRVTPAAAARTERPSDRVELSDRARFLSKMAALPEVRADLVDRVRQEIRGGSYETEEKLDLAIAHLLDEL